jgi:hypothetical protein
MQGRVFGVELTHEQPMRYFQGHWMDADSAADVERWSVEADEAAGQAAAAATIAEPEIEQ